MIVDGATIVGRPITRNMDLATNLCDTTYSYIQASIPFFISHGLEIQPLPFEWRFLGPFSKFVTTEIYHQQLWHILALLDYYRMTNLEYIGIKARVVCVCVRPSN